MKRIIALLLSLVMMFTFVACGSSDKGTAVETTTADTESLKIATDAVDKKFAEIKNIDSAEFYATLLGGDKNDELSEDEKEAATKILDAARKPFKYEVVSAKKIDDKTIEVTLDVTRANGKTAASKFYEDFINVFIESGTSDVQMTDEEIDLEIMKILADSFTKAETIKDKINIEVILVDGKWVVDEKSVDFFTLLCNDFTSTFNDIGEELVNNSK